MMLEMRPFRGTCACAATLSFFMSFPAVYVVALRSASVCTLHALRCLVHDRNCLAPAVLNGLLTVMDAFDRVWHLRAAVFPYVFTMECRYSLVTSSPRACWWLELLEPTQPKLSKEEQQKLLDERLAKMRADKARQEKELEKQQEISRIQMNKELNEVFLHSSTELFLPQTGTCRVPGGCLLARDATAVVKLRRLVFLRLFANNLPLFSRLFLLLRPRAPPTCSAIASCNLSGHATDALLR